jgi:3-oxoacyl-ACP reductase-like protein
MRLAAATGGSQASATAQAMGGQTRAMDAALRSFQPQEQANQGLLANLYSQQYGAMQQDRAFRRQTGVDIFSNIANLGAGILGQGYGDKLFKDRQNQMGGY